MGTAERPALRTLVCTLPASGLLFAALALLRQQIAVDLEISFAFAVELGLPLGWFYDAVAVVAVTCMALLIEAALDVSWRLPWTLLAVFLWLSTFANVLYFRYFESMLELWVLRFHLGDAPLVWDIALPLASTWLIGSSAVLAVLAVGAALVRPTAEKRSRWRPHAQRRARWALAGSTLLILVAAVLTHRVVDRIRLYDKYHGPMVLKDQVLQSWSRDLHWLWQESRSFDRRGELYRGGGRRLTATEAQLRFAELSELLHRYRDGRDPQSAGAGPAPPNPIPTDLRALLGFDSDEPINVILLFVEGLRTFELEHPEIGPAVLPRLRHVLDRRAIFYTQAYSSAVLAGQTVRGQFSTLCSMLPNMGGSATYLRHPFVDIDCLASTFSENGYETLWLNSYSRAYHNKSVFEKAHGTDHFFDETYFRRMGVTEKIDRWGLADRPFLEESMGVFDQFFQNGHPFFANLLTISSHPPFKVIEQGPLPGPLAAATAGMPEYQGYLSKLRYVDESLGHFFDLFFASDLAENTLVVLLADHSTGVRPHLPLSRVQLEEIRFRVPLAWISRDLGAPMRIAKPAHQIDVAPTVARIVGIEPKPTWIGRDLLAGSGSPWIYLEDDLCHYRTDNRACYTLPGQAGLSCWRTDAGSDPLFSDALQQVGEDSEQTRFFRDVATAASEAIELDLVMPPAEPN